MEKCMKKCKSCKTKSKKKIKFPSLKDISDKSKKISDQKVQAQIHEKHQPSRKERAKIIKEKFSTSKAKAVDYNPPKDFIKKSDIYEPFRSNKYSYIGI